MKTPIMDALTEVFEECPGALSHVRAFVTASEEDHRDNQPARERQVGMNVLDLLTDGHRPDLAHSMLRRVADEIDPAALGRWYIEMYPDKRWPMGQWRDLSSVDEEGQEAMRAGLLAARDQFAFGYNDEEVVFDYLSDRDNDLGKDEVEYSPYAIARLWQRRCVRAYRGYDDVADKWLVYHDKAGVLNELHEAAPKLLGTEILSEVKTSFGRELVARNRQFCWIDQLGASGKLWCCKRRDNQEEEPLA